MSFLDSFSEKWEKISQQAEPAVKSAVEFCKNCGESISLVWRYVVKLKKVILAVPVGVGAVILALKNLAELPETVGLNLLSDGTFSMLIARELAVLGPLAITALCLLLMFGSKRTLTPWLVSLFSLAVPLLILITNTFPS